MFILTVRNDRLGDLILALPAVTALRRRYPDARIGIVVAPATAAVLELYPEAVEPWIDDGEPRTRLIQDRPDSVLFLHPDRGWARAARRARVPQRIGTAYRLYAWNFNRRVAVHRKSSPRHEAELNLLLAAPLVGEVPLAPPELRVPEPLHQRAQGTLKRATGWREGRPFVVVHPGSGGSAWNWPPDCYAAAVERLSAAGMGVVVTGGPHEHELCRTVAGSKGVVLAGQTDLPLLGAVLAASRVCVAGSTGPMHLAAALGRPVVGLFSPRTSHSPRRWGPLGEGHQVLMPEGCADLGRRPAADAIAAVMRRIAPDRVVRAVGEVARRTGATV